jgi:hypothetical protein
MIEAAEASSVWPAGMMGISENVKTNPLLDTAEKLP